MQKLIPLLLLSFLGATFQISAATTVNYTESNEDIVNPDRGFYKPFDGVASNFVPLSLSTLQALRSTSRTSNWDANYQVKSSIVLRHYILDSYVGTDTIEQTFLDKIQTDFDTARAAGIRLILRFSYTITANTGSCGSWICPPYGDAPKSRVQAHISQLSPYLQNNEDVIFTVQNGFIGVWGEQYFTDYFGNAATQNGQFTDANWYDRSDVILWLLQAVPASRMIQLRTPQMKQKYYAPNAPITTSAMSSTQAHNGSDASRLGFHNDCFLTDESDQGTYSDLGSSTLTPQYGTSMINTLKNYHKSDSQYTVVGGETCADVNSSTQVEHPNNCSDNVVQSMADLNYSFLNADYNNAVNNDWETDGCMDTIKNRLGYRLVLESGVYPDAVDAGTSTTINLTIKNVGFAAPANARDLNLVLRNSSNNNEYSLPITGPNSDTRKWLSEQSFLLSPSITIPADIEAGSYQLFLKINDSSNNGLVQNRAEYSIQLANTNMWEASTGYNNLNHTISIGETNIPETNIVIDGNTSDWSSIAYSNTASGQSTTGIKTYSDTSSLYIVVTGQNLGDGYQVYIDSDNSVNTGFGSNGADYLIENGTLLSYQGDGSTWSWSAVGTIISDNSTNTSSVRELAIAKQSFSTLSTTINISFIDILNWGVQSRLPSDSSFMPMTTN